MLHFVPSKIRLPLWVLVLGIGLSHNCVADDDALQGDRTLLERATESAQDMTSRALEMLGVHYRRGGDSPESGFDCSGLVQRVVQDALGLNLPRTAREMAKVGEQIPLSDLKPGDLVFFNTMRRAFSHVGIYLGDNRFVHAPAPGGEVRVEDMNTKYWISRFQGARRLSVEAKP